MARTRLWSAFIIGLAQLGELACTKTEPPTLSAQAPLMLDATGERLSLDETQVPVVPGCGSGQVVQKTSEGWSCVTPGPGGVPVTWDTISDKPISYPPAVHEHTWEEVANKPESFPPAAHGHTWGEVADKPESFPPAEHTHGFSDLTGVSASTQWPGTQLWSRVTGAPDFALASTVGEVTSRVSTVEGGITEAQGKLTQVEGRLVALEASGGASTLVMSAQAEDSELAAAGYTLVGLGRPESYTARASIPTAVSHVSGAAVLGTKVYVAGGLVGNNQCTSHLWEYDLVTNQWRARQQMAVARYGHVVVGARGKVYVMGGYHCSGGGTQINEIYDPHLDAWTLGAPLPDHNHHGAAYGILSDGKLHVVGGHDHIAGVNSLSHVVYDFDTDTWSTASDLPVARTRSASGTLPDGRLIVAGGYDGSNSWPETYIYAPVENAWTQVASMPSALHLHSGAIIAGRFHAFGGYDSDHRNYHYIYDPRSDTWSSGAAVPYSAHTIATGQLRGGALLVGGWDGSALTAVHEYLAPLYLYSK